MHVAHLDAKIALAKKWLYNSYLERVDSCGWSTFEGRNVISEWGGTLDAVRALLISGENISSRELSKSILWLKGKQQLDGGWKSWEIKNSVTESTGWVLLTLQIANESEKCESICRGHDFLISNQNNDGGWGSFKGDNSRVYPTLIAVWTLSKSRKDIALPGVQWLLNAINNDGGWGFSSRCQNSNIAITSIVLYALLITGHLIDQRIKNGAIKWILKNRQGNNLWEPIIEDWNTFVDPLTGEEQPCRTSYFSSSWAILALLEANISPFDKRLKNSLIAFINSQLPDGSWPFLNYDKKIYTWVVSNGVCTLDKLRDCLVASPIQENPNLPLIKYIKYLMIISGFNLIAVIVLLEFNLKIFSKFGLLIADAFSFLSEKLISVFSFGEIEAGQVVVGIIGTVLGGILLHKITVKFPKNEKSSKNRI